MKDIEVQIKKTFESIENIERATTAPFFETRLKARMQRQLIETNGSWFMIKKPVWAIASLIAYLCINVLVLNYRATATKIAQSQQEQQSTIETFANDYQLLNSTSQY